MGGAVGKNAGVKLPVHSIGGRRSRQAGVPVLQQAPGAGLRDAIEDWIRTCDLDRPQLRQHQEREFSELALALFRYQFEHNVPYRKLCLHRGVTPERVQRWQDIPAVMTSSFKVMPFFCGDPQRDATACFHTSGTTRQQPGKHFFRTLALYRLAALRMFEWACMPDYARNRSPAVPSGDERAGPSGDGVALPVLILGPSASLFPHSSLGQMFSWIAEAFGDGLPEICFSPDGLDAHRAMAWLEKQRAQGKPVLVLATSLTLLDLIEIARSVSGSVSRRMFSAGTLILDTGGYKGRRLPVSLREGTFPSRQAFVDKVSAFTGLEPEWLFNEYGMTELSSQCYQTVFTARRFRSGVLVAPPWLRIIACDPQTLAPLPEGERGVLRFFDLANFDSVAMLQTEDIGVVRGRTLELHGRDPGAEPRGCSLLAEEFTSLQGGA